MKNCHLDDETIGHIGQMIQIAILTGTDVIDHFRMMQLVVDDDGKILLDEDYKEVFTQQIERMLEAVDILSVEHAEEDNSANRELLD